MLTEEFFAAVSGPPLTSNTAIAKDVAIYHQTLHPSYGVKATFKKSTTPPGALAVSDAHVFAAQQDKAYVHVYSRLRGGQEAFVPVPERVRSLAFVAGSNVLVAGTAEGRLLLWETASGRLVVTPPCHVQAVTCLAATPGHVLSGSDDSNVHVWSLPQLLALAGSRGSSTESGEPEPERTLARHRAAITGLAVGGSSISRDANLGVSASRDKTVVLWNYQTGVALRTLLFAAAPVCLTLDPAARAIYVATEAAAGTAAQDNDARHAEQHSALYAVELFGAKPLVGSRAAEAESTAVSVTTPFGLVPAEAGTATCLAVSYDGATLLSGHPRGRLLQWNLADGGSGSSSLPVELANLNAAVTNLVFVPPAPLAAAASSSSPKTSVHTVVKPSQAARDYAVTLRFDEPLPSDSRDGSFEALTKLAGFPQQSLEKAILAFQQPWEGDDKKKNKDASGNGTTTAADADMQDEQLLEVVNQLKASYQQALQQLKASQP